MARLRKVIKVNGVDKRVMDIVGLLNVALWHDLSLVEGSPSDRRRFMDNTLGQVDAAYLNAIDTYENIFPQRNALLKRINDRQASPKELRFWDEQIVGQHHHRRAAEVFARTRNPRAGRASRPDGQARSADAALSAELPADLRGRRSVFSFDTFGLDLHRELTPDEIAPRSLATSSRRKRAKLIYRGVTLCGPHRDELRLFINERDLGL